MIWFSIFQMLYPTIRETILLRIVPAIWKFKEGHWLLTKGGELLHRNRGTGLAWPDGGYPLSLTRGDRNVTGTPAISFPNFHRLPLYPNRPPPTKKCLCGAMAARSPCKGRVAGSNPAISSIGGCCQVGMDALRNQAENVGSSPTIRTNNSRRALFSGKPA